MSRLRLAIASAWLPITACAANGCTPSTAGRPPAPAVRTIEVHEVAPVPVAVPETIETITIPARELGCVADSDCALTDLAVHEAAGDYRCCDSNIRAVGTVDWVRTLERTCASYEPLRGRDKSLPSCGVSTGPVSATLARCDLGRCVACLETNDGSPAICRG